MALSTMAITLFALVRSRRLIAVVGCFALIAITGSTLATAAPPTGASAKFITYDADVARTIPGEYLVVFKSVSAKQTRALARKLAKSGHGQVDHVLTATMRGFSAGGLDDAWARQVSKRKDVAFVRQNFEIFGSDLRGGPNAPVPWNLDRIDQRASLAMDRDLRYKTGPVSGAPVPVYVLDNGVDRTHTEFASPSGSRVTDVADVTGHNFARCSAPSAADANHGTAAASIVAGSRLGITPTMIRNVKVLDRDLLGIDCAAGSPTSVALGLEAVAKDLTSTHTSRAVVNLSVGWIGQTPDVTMAIAKLQSLGAVIVAAAGNENADAATTVPANLPGVVAVGGITESGQRFVTPTGGSNYGPTVSLWAPGFGVRAADWPATPDPARTALVNGTSFAAPHVAGAVALRWQQQPSLTGPQVVQQLEDRATRNMLTDLGPGSHNALLFVGEDAPTPVAMSTTPLEERGSATVRSARVSADGTRLYVAGSGRLGYRAYDSADVAAGPIWSVPQDEPSDLDCADISASELTTPGVGGRYVFFGCTDTRSRTAVVVATQEDNAEQWRSTLEPGSVLAGVTGGVVEDFGLTVYALTTELDGSRCPQTFVSELDLETGAVLRRMPLTAPGFPEPCHAGVDLVLLEVPVSPGSATTRTELVAASYADPPGADRTFLWRIDPIALQVESFGEVSPPASADPARGMYATALAVDPYETNGGTIRRPGHVFLTTQIRRSGPAGDPTTGQWAYLYRLDDSLVAANPIEAVPRAVITSLWCDQGDVFYGGLESASGNFRADTELFLRKNEGVTFNPRRWRLGSGPRDPLDPRDPLGLRGVTAVGQRGAYLVSVDSDSLDVNQFAIY